MPQAGDKGCHHFPDSSPTVHLGCSQLHIHTVTSACSCICTHVCTNTLTVCTVIHVDTYVGMITYPLTQVYACLTPAHICTHDLHTLISYPAYMHKYMYSHTHIHAHMCHTYALHRDIHTCVCAFKPMHTCVYPPALDTHSHKSYTHTCRHRPL